MTIENIVHNAEERFNLAWENPSYTQIELKKLDINSILTQYETCSPSLKLTKDQVWMAEKLKAYNPLKYIPQVVSQADSFGKETFSNGEFFYRASHQRQWLNPDNYGEVFEAVYVNSLEQRITFLGVSELTHKGQVRKASNAQPLFHVQHSVEGLDNKPLNVWKIVHLTSELDQSLIERFKQFPTNVLPSFLEIYLNEDLKIPVKNKNAPIS